MCVYVCVCTACRGRTHPSYTLLFLSQLCNKQVKLFEKRESKQLWIQLDKGVNVRSVCAVRCAN